MIGQFDSGITDVSGMGIDIGQNESSVTGCNVVICDSGAISDIDSRGISLGTRETVVLSPASSDAYTNSYLGAGTRESVAKIFGMGGSIKDGIGTSSISQDDGRVDGATVAVNAIGRAHDPHSGKLIAGSRSQDNNINLVNDALFSGKTKNRLGLGNNTTVGVVATNAELNNPQLSHLAAVSHDRIALAVRPAHLPGGGGIMFALSTTRLKHVGLDFDQIITTVNQDTSMAMVNTVESAKELGGIPSINECGI